MTTDASAGQDDANPTTPVADDATSTQSPPGAAPESAAVGTPEESGETASDTQATDGDEGMVFTAPL